MRQTKVDLIRQIELRDKVIDRLKVENDHNKELLGVYKSLNPAAAMIIALEKIIEALTQTMCTLNSLADKARRG